VQVLARGLDVPWGLAFLPDRGALVSERDTGRILALSPSGGSPREVMRLPDVDTASGEGGLLGLAVSP
jgi:glucose/arabinose dehydrogenase